MDSIVINNINLLMPQVNVYGTSENINEEINLLKEIINLFGELTKKKFKEVEAFSYIPHRNLGRFLFTSNKYDEALQHLEIATKLFSKIDDLDSENNNANSKRMIARCMIDIGLRDANNHLIETSSKILTNLLRNAKVITIQSIIDEINSDLLIIDGIRNNKILTTMEFILPFPLKLIEEAVVDFKYEDLDCRIKSSLIQSRLCPFESTGFVEMKYDKHGLSMHSKIRLMIPEYIEPRKTVTVSDLTGETAFKPLVMAIDVLNKFIDYYKVATSDYWVPRVTHKMLTSFRCVIESNGVQVFSSPYSGNGSYSTYKVPPTISDDEYLKLVKHMEKNDVELWELLIANAKDSILVKSFREAIIAINSAFENYLALKVPELLNSRWNNEEVQLYLNGQVTYSEFFLNQFIDEDSFNLAVERGVIKNLSPSTFHMIKTCCKECKMKVSVKKYNSLVSKIRHGRNDVAHGNKIVISENDVLKSLNALNEFIDIFDIES